MTLFYKILLSATVATTTFFVAPAQKTVRHVNTEFDVTNLIVPESFEVDSHKLMTDWYLTRYTIMDKEADSRKSVSLNDGDYISRLQKLPTSIEMPFNDLVKSFIKMYVERRKGLVESMLGLSIYYMPIFEDALDRYGLPMELKNLAIIESALNPNAVSRAGATGLWQFMSSTALGEGLEVNTLVDERRDPYKSSDAAARFLKKLYNMYGDWTLAIAAYNCGPGNVNKALRRAGGGKKDFWEIYNFLPSETRNYIPAFIAANYAMTYYKDHNISPVLASKPIIVDSVLVSQRVHFQQISDVLGIPMEEIRALNPQYRADIIPGDIKPYALVLPHIQTLCFIEYQDSIINHDHDLYARRETVEPGINRKTTDADGKEYIETAVVKYHKVKSNETVAAIAQRYGVSQSEVIRANGGRKALKRGKTLAINTIERRLVPVNNTTDSVAATQNSTDTNLTQNGSAQVSDSVAVAAKNAGDTNNTDVAATKVSTAINNSGKNKKTTEQAKPTTTSYTIKAGDTLTKIATQNGITVDELKKANNLKSDNIQTGQKLKIPGKSNGRSAASAKKGTGRKSASRGKRRRR